MNEVIIQNTHSVLYKVLLITMKFNTSSKYFNNDQLNFYKLFMYCNFMAFFTKSNQFQFSLYLLPVCQINNHYQTSFLFKKNSPFYNKYKLVLHNSFTNNKNKHHNKTTNKITT